jgi:hypothetical protein
MRTPTTSGRGLGFELGDGRLSYRPETIIESYYLLQVVSWLG